MGEEAGERWWVAGAAGIKQSIITPESGAGSGKEALDVSLNRTQWVPASVFTATGLPMVDAWMAFEEVDDEGNEEGGDGDEA